MNIPQTVSGRPVSPRGVHLHPNGFHNYWMQEADYWCGLLVDMGISWVMAISESDNLYISGAAEALLDAGVIPIVRFAYKFPAPWPHGDATAQLANLYAQYGAPLVVQFANEPFDPREWRDEEVPPCEEAWAIIVQRWHEAANAITGNGGIAGFPDGPSYSDNPFLRIGDEDGHWAAGRAVYLGHHYGKGRPVNYPRDDVSKYGTPLTMEQYRAALDDFADDPAWNWVDTPLEVINQQRAEWPPNPNLTPVDDDVCWRGWEKVQWYAHVAFGHSVQMAMTEGGWQPRDRAGSGNSIDLRWPYTTPRMVALKTLAMYQDAPLEMFAVCPWLLADGDMAGGGDVGWPYDAWHGWAFAELYGPQKPVIQALIENPPGGGAMDGIEIVDADGNPQDWEWLVANYGPLVIHTPFQGPGWRVVKLAENKLTQHFVTVTVLDAEGGLVVGQAVPWYYSTAPLQDQCGPPDGVPAGMIGGRYAGPGYTNVNGQIGLGMSYDGQYEPPNIGPYGVWMCSQEQSSAVVFGLGWLLGTPYWHLDVTFQWVEEAPPPDDECPWDEIETHLQAIEAHTATIRRRARLVDTEVAAIRELRGLG